MDRERGHGAGRALIHVQVAAAAKGLSLASTAPRPVPRTGVLPSSLSLPPAPIENREMLPAPVLTVNRNWPLWVISTQHGAVCRSANGEAPIGDRLPSARSRKAEMVPVPVLCALDTNSWRGLVGRNSLPNGPSP